jgi:hypothetical protein
MSERDLGRKFFLAELVVYVETILGHANWNAIAAVIAAVHFALDEPRGVSTDTESLKSVINEFQKQNPGIYADVNRWASSAVGSRHRDRTETGDAPAEG